MSLLISRVNAPPSLNNFLKRTISTLSNNPHIYVFPNKRSLGPSHIISLLPTDPPSLDLAIGTTTTIPPSPMSFTENTKFVDLLQSTLKVHAHQDPDVQAQAKAFASTAGSSLGSGGAFFPHQRSKRRGDPSSGGGAGGDGAGGASAQGGAGGGGRGGWIHLSDSRNPPDYGRIAWPEDIFGSLQVDNQGKFVGETGEYQPSGTYRIITRDGILGLSDFLRSKVVERLAEEEKRRQGQAS